MKRIAVGALLMALALGAGADDTRRGRLKVAARGAAVRDAGADTIVPSPGMIGLSGYEKALKSSRESLLVSNCGRLGVRHVVIELTYLDLSGRMLHRRVVGVDVRLPGGETRQVTFPSWDRQKTMYYELTGKNRRSDGTPYRVRATVLGIVRE